MTLEDPEYLRELFSEFESISVRRMFGGFGLFADGLMFGLVLQGDIFLKADKETIPMFQAEGSRPFVYTAKGREVTVGYWRLPDRLLDDPEELATFARGALRAARRAADKKSLKSRKLVQPAKSTAIRKPNRTKRRK